MIVSLQFLRDSLKSAPWARLCRRAIPALAVGLILGLSGLLQVRVASDAPPPSTGGLPTLAPQGPPNHAALKSKASPTDHRASSGNSVNNGASLGAARRRGHNAAPEPRPLIEIPPNQMEIDINDTAAANDDVVRLGAKTPARQFWIPCALYFNPPSQGSDVQVNITSLLGEVGFSANDPSNGSGFTNGNNGYSASLSNIAVKADGTKTFFWITGIKSSANVGEEQILVADSSSGVSYASQFATVFWFRSPQDSKDISGQMSLSGGTAYAATNVIVEGQSQTQLATQGEAISMTSWAIVAPSGLDYTVPQLASLEVGLEQNIGGTARTMHYANPVITWNQQQAQNDAAILAAENPPQNVQTQPEPQYVDSSQKVTVNYVSDTEDDPGASANVPFYDRSAMQLISADKASKSIDLPYLDADPAYKITNVTDQLGNVVATITYTLTQMGIAYYFRDWCTIADNGNSVKGQTQWLASGTWTLNTSVAIPPGTGGASGVAGSQNTVPPANTPTNEDAPCFNTLQLGQGFIITNGPQTLTYTF